MEDLKENSNTETWENWLKRYDKVLEGVRGGQAQLLECQCVSYFSDAKNKPLSLGPEDLKKMVEYKLSRGKFRPGLAKVVLCNSPAQVRRATEESFERLDMWDGDELTEIQLKQLLSPLMELKGIGVATAALLLSLRRPDDIPPMSDEALAFFLKKEETFSFKYNLQEYKIVVDGVRHCADNLTLTCRQVEHAVFAAVKCRNVAGATSTTSNNKRRRVDVLLKTTN